MTTIMSGALGARGASVAGTATAAVWCGVEEGFSLQRQPFPRLRPGEMVVAVELATICGSDLHTIAGDRPTPVPSVLGHESVGSIVATCGAAWRAGHTLPSHRRHRPSLGAPRLSRPPWQHRRTAPPQQWCARLDA
jgi:hypothetical protein